MPDMADLPHLWQKPAYQQLLDCLEELEVKPLVWGVNVSTPDQVMSYEGSRSQDRREIARFLSSLISSNLTWIEGEDQREEIWNTASRRLAGRCGRTAMGEIRRDFPFSLNNRNSWAYFNISIREPPLTGDSLGLKTWGSSYVLARLLPELAVEYLLHIDFDAARVLELGSGTGLLGMAAARLWRTHVTLTDLPAIMPNLVYNIESNRPVLGPGVDAAPLTWGNPDETDKRFHKHHQFEVVIAADPLYDDDHPNLLAEAIHQQLALGPTARVLVMVPYRDSTTRKLVQMLREQLLRQDPPLACVGQKIVTGADDWGEEDEGQQVDCWYGIFQRQ